MKNRPPKMRVKVVPTEPETGMPLDVEGLLILVLLEVLVVVVVEVPPVADPVPESVILPVPPLGLVVAVADRVASPMG